jgi:hypothetical membrane protein
MVLADPTADHWPPLVERASGVDGDDHTTRPLAGWVVLSAALSPVLVAAAWLSADAVQPASYSPIRQTLSVLAGRAGTDRWVMTVALFLVGGCYLVTAAGLRRLGNRATVLLVVAGLSSICVAVNPEPAHGSTPQHLAWTALGEVAIAIWPASIIRRPSSRTPIPSVVVLTAMTAASLALLGWLVIETQQGNALGLAERLSLSAQTSLPFFVALLLWRTDRTGSQPDDRAMAGWQIGLTQMRSEPVTRLPDQDSHPVRVRTSSRR